MLALLGQPESREGLALARVGAGCVGVAVRKVGGHGSYLPCMRPLALKFGVPVKFHTFAGSGHVLKTIQLFYMMSLSS